MYTMYTTAICNTCMHMYMTVVFMCIHVHVHVRMTYAEVGLGLNDYVHAWSTGSGLLCEAKYSWYSEHCGEGRFPGRVLNFLIVPSVLVTINSPRIDHYTAMAGPRPVVFASYSHAGHSI